MRSLVGTILDKAPIPYVGRGSLAFPFAAQTDMSAQMRAMSSVGTLFAIVNRTSNAVSQVDWHLYRPAKSGKPEDRTEVTSHLALEIWNNPNPHYCLAPDTRVITADLEWVPVGDLAVGDQLLGFDEVQKPGKRRQWRPAEVIATGRTMLPCYRITFDDGTQIVASEDHCWLTQCPRNGNYWRKTKDLMGTRPGGNHQGPTRVQKLLDVWEPPTSYEAGYLAGVYDGEACLGAPRSLRGMSLGVAQKENEVLAELESLLPRFGYRVKRGGSRSSGVECLFILGGVPEILRFLGSVRPQRLLAKWRRFGPEALGAVQRLDNVAVIGLEYLGNREVVTLGTSTETFVAEGFGTHNSRQKLVEAGQQHVDLTGEGWLVVARNPKVRSIPLELWPVRPDRMNPVPHPQEFIAGYTYTAPGGEVVPLETDSVLRLMMPNPLDPYRGMGPVQSVLVDLDAQRYSAEWNRNFFINSAAPGGIIEVDKRLSDDDFKQMVTRWREAHQGVGNAHRVAVLEQGKWVPASYSMRDMQFTELRRVAREVILEAFGMSKFAVGDITDVNRATADASAVWFARYLSVPRLERWKAMLNGPYLGLFGAAGKGLEFDYDNPVPEDEAAALAEMSAKATTAKTYIDAGFTPESVKEALELPEALEFKEEEPPAPVPPELAQAPGVPVPPGAPPPPAPPQAPQPEVAEAAVALLARVLLAEARVGRGDDRDERPFRREYWR